MPLYDITNKPVKVEPADAENYIALVKLRSSLHTNTFERLVKTVDEAIESCQPSQSSSLVWTRSAALFGHGSQQPHKWVKHLWDNVESVVGPGKLTLKAVGGLLRWRISLRKDTWLVFRRDSDTIDPETDRLVTISEYWINNSFQLRKEKEESVDVAGLAEAWGARMR